MTQITGQATIQFQQSFNATMQATGLDQNSLQMLMQMMQRRRMRRAARWPPRRRSPCRRLRSIRKPSQISLFAAAPRSARRGK